ncbi:tetratricopeptide repeat protein [Acidithiobacillus ferridurans]|uniref:tetratricopeptide repeat protein n=1 Tax=Acidithiobacillus ferridurans TaxID=1232575 RepID=UPI001C07A3EA|nr:tetratricopeptide repeat protein [Acidithiobacillus ferridurans]MBU2732457.1 tetratricopeptide repeat protein [Acidithiobacillus ferridurans]
MKQPPEVICPHCHRNDTTWKAKAKVWECKGCEERFDAAPPEDLPDPLAGFEESYEQRARVLAESSAWRQAIMDDWPTPLAATYALLKAKLHSGQIDASALILKDLTELLARFSALALACDILEHGPADKQSEVSRKLFEKPLSMGAWIQLADSCSSWIETDPQDRITQPIALMWRQGKKQTELGKLLSNDLVHWRNETIGHGVRGSDLESTMQDLEKFLGDGAQSLHRALAPHDKLGEILILRDDQGIKLMGAQTQHDPSRFPDLSHVLGPLRQLFLQRKEDQPLQDKVGLPLRSLMAVRRCNICGQAETFHYDSTQWPNKLLPNFRVLNYERGHAMRVPGSTDTDMMMVLESVKGHTETSDQIDLERDASLPADVIQMLDEQSIEKGYCSPVYLRDGLAKFLEERLDADKGGLYWLRAPAHAGKSTFVMGIDPHYAKTFKEQSLIDLPLAVAVFSIRREYQFHLAQMADILREQLKTALNLTSGREKLPEMTLDSPNAQTFVQFLARFQDLGGRSILVVLDGLDELVEEQPSILDILPSPDDLPPHVFLLLTSRPVPECPSWMRARLQPLLSAPGREVGLGDADYTDLLKTYATIRLKNNPQREKGAYVDIDGLHAKLLERSGARFLYYRFLVDRLAEGDLQFEDLDALTHPEKLLPQFVQALYARYEGTPMGNRIERTLDQLALSEDVFNRQNLALPALAQDSWQGLPMSVLCDEIEGTQRPTVNMVITLNLLKPLLGTWRGDNEQPLYRLGLKGLDDLLRQHDLPTLAWRQTEALLERQAQWCQIPESERGDVLDYRGVGLDWTLRHLSGVLSLLSSDQRQVLRMNTELLLMLCNEMQRRGEEAAHHSRNRDALQMYVVVEALLREITGSEEPDIAMFGDPKKHRPFVKWVVILSARADALADLGEGIQARADYDQATKILESLGAHLKEQFPVNMAAGLAGIYGNRGMLLQRQREHIKARADYDQAIEIWESLRAYLGEQFTPDMAAAFASAYKNRGNLLQSQEEGIKARVDYDQAIEISKSLRAYLGEQFTPDMAAVLAVIYGNRGNILHSQEEDIKALADYDQAIEIGESLHAHLGEQFTPDMAVGLAGTYMNRGVLLQSQEEDIKARADYDQAIEIGESLRAHLGEQFTPDMAAGLARTYTNRGNLMQSQEEGIKARADYDQAIEIWESLHAHLGERFTPDMANHLAGTYMFRGVLLKNQGEVIQARADYNQAIALWNTIEAKMGSDFPPQWKEIRDSLVDFLDEL